MARFLSPEWFASVAAAGAEPDAGPPLVVLEQVVDETPDGRVAYRVEVRPEGARIVWPVPPDAPPADLRISSDWTTSVGIARGDLSAQRALMEGRLRVKGNPAAVAADGAELARIDPVPATVRVATTY